MWASWHYRKKLQGFPETPRRRNRTVLKAEKSRYIFFGGIALLTIVVSAPYLIENPSRWPGFLLLAAAWSAVFVCFAAFRITLADGMLSYSSPFAKTISV